MFSVYKIRKRCLHVLIIVYIHTVVLVNQPKKSPVVVSGGIVMSRRLLGESILEVSGVRSKILGSLEARFLKRMS